MSEYEEDELMTRFEKWDGKKAKQNFLARMERKLNHKERYSH